MKDKLVNKILIIGGTGFLGYHAMQALIKRGYKVDLVCRTEPSPKLNIPKDVGIHLIDITKITDIDYEKLLSKYTVVVFAAGVDDRTIPKRPAYEYFYTGNVLSTEKLINAVNKTKVKKVIILGSYFAHFAKKWKDMELTKHHPYIRSRIEQENLALTKLNADKTVAILEIPYTFGTMPTKKPLWILLFKYVKYTPVIFYTQGGTSVADVKTVANGIVAAIEQAKGKKSYQIFEKNMMWEELLSMVSMTQGKKKRVIPVPIFLLKTLTLFLKIFFRLLGKEHGLDPVRFMNLQTRETFLESSFLKFEIGDVDQAIKETVIKCEEF